MAAPLSAYQDRHFLAVIGDEVEIEMNEHCTAVLLTRTGLCDWSLARRRWSKTH